MLMRTIIPLTAWLRGCKQLSPGPDTWQAPTPRLLPLHLWLSDRADPGITKLGFSWSPKGGADPRRQHASTRILGLRFILLVCPQQDFQLL